MIHRFWQQTSDASYLGEKRDLFSININGRIIRDLTEAQAKALSEVDA